MTYAYVLFLIGAVQVILVLLTVGFIVLTRSYRRWRDQQNTLAASRLMEVVRHFLLGEREVSHIIEVLRALPERIAIIQVITLSGNRIPTAFRGQLGDALREEPWIGRVIARASSPFWWRRLEAARILAITGGPGDRIVIEQLLKDHHPAIQTAAMAYLLREPDARLIATLLDVLPQQAAAVRIYQSKVLRGQINVVAPLLLQRLRGDHPAEYLTTWIQLAATLENPDCLNAVADLMSHPSSKVRIAVAQAMTRYYNPRALTILRAMLHDSEWSVRAEAARGLGGLATTADVVPLSTALGDSAWWVRFRAALSLAMLGEGGRRALRSARLSQDTFAADMATLVSGLSDGDVLELSEG